MEQTSPIETAGGGCWPKGWGGICSAWNWCGPAVGTRAASASGPKGSEGSGWRCRTTATGSCGATGSGGEVARFPDVTSPLDSGAHLRVAGFVAMPEQGLRASAGDGRGYDSQRDEPLDAAATGTGGVRIFNRADAWDSLFTKLTFCRYKGDVRHPLAREGCPDQYR
jgi:hypothetical protein